MKSMPKAAERICIATCVMLTTIGSSRIVGEYIHEGVGFVGKIGLVAFIVSTELIALLFLAEYIERHLRVTTDRTKYFKILIPVINSGIAMLLIDQAMRLLAG